MAVKTDSDEFRLSKSTLSSWGKELLRVAVMAGAVLAGSAGGAAATQAEEAEMRKQVNDLEKRLSALETKLEERTGR